jgi:hypothetical protein
MLILLGGDWSVEISLLLLFVCLLFVCLLFVCYFVLLLLKGKLRCCEENDV